MLPRTSKTLSREARFALSWSAQGRKEAPVHVSHSIHTRRLVPCLAAALSFVSVVLSACSESAPTITAASPLTATVSGHVYQRFTAASGEPLLANVAIRVSHTDGSASSAR